MIDKATIIGADEFQIHGGRLHAARLRFPNASLPWLDLSTGINPNAYPYDPAGVDYNSLPDPVRLQDLLESAATAFGIKHSDFLTATPGSEAGLRALALLLSKKRIGVAQPAYSSHRDAWAGVGAEIIPFKSGSYDFPDADVIIIVNPNNPTGTQYTRQNLMDLADRQYQKGGYLIIDEAFADCVEGLSFCDHIADDGPGSALILLRSFGKFYGLAGLRLGFVAASRTLICRLRDLFGDWPISIDALTAGIQAYRDHEWQHHMRAELAGRAAGLDRLLDQSMLNPIGGTSLFRLVETDRALQVFAHLAQQGILTRPFAHNPAWLRVGLPRDQDFCRLENALRILP